MIRNATKRLSNKLSGCGILKNRLISSCSASTQIHKEAVLPSYSMKDSFRYSPEEGYVRTSPFNDVTMENLTIDQYIWKDLDKFQGNCAIVSIKLYSFIQSITHTWLIMSFCVVVLHLERINFIRFLKLIITYKHLNVQKPRQTTLTYIFRIFNHFFFAI